MKPMKSIRSSSLLHSVEDLSTDSTCVYKARTGFDSNRGSRRRSKNATATSTDEILARIPLTNGIAGDSSGVEQRGAINTIKMSANRGLSKSMIIPTPVSDFSHFDECSEKERSKTCCDKIKRYLNIFYLNLIWSDRRDNVFLSISQSSQFRYLDITLLKDPKFIAMCLSVTMMSTGCPYMLYFLPAYALSAGNTMCTKRNRNYKDTIANIRIYMSVPTTATQLPL